MNNQRIILIQRIHLLHEGVIGSKGTHTFTDYKGVSHSCEMPEDIFTPGAWLKQGYRVKSGENARARVSPPGSVGASVRFAARGVHRTPAPHMEVPDRPIHTSAHPHLLYDGHEFLYGRSGHSHRYPINITAYHVTLAGSSCLFLVYPRKEGIYYG